MLNNQIRYLSILVENLTEEEKSLLCRRAVTLSWSNPEAIKSFCYVTRSNNIYPFCSATNEKIEGEYVCSSYQEFNELINLWKLDRLLGINHESI
ncbi:hypothetical protein D6D94_08190 [Moraxella catarrhalis]|nr:hypothetical protein E9W_06921 [Moraxella catarrhalis CO72]MPW57137.1 hypothetical protein [Moraxella catarrhalis]MPW60435.1 hypothetical protein [Moraxella catarrhalis]MPW67409.1 hypothetical protein [Moraxella catarrhalis]MPX07973.1 hypothetical protein [Moraxella catarrhalis]